MLRSLLFCLLILVVLRPAEAQTGKWVLIYTRNFTADGKGYVHDNIAASVTALTALCEKEGIAVTTSDDPEIFTDANLKKYHALIFSNTNNEAFSTQAQRDALVRYIRAGGGFVGIHSACGSEREWPWFWAMLGGKFLRHPKMQPFDIKIIDHDHPATAGLGEVWQWEDECYFIDQLNPDIRVLMAVDLKSLDDPKRDEYPGVTFGDYFPLAWYHHFECGREFYTALGHKIEHYQDAQFLKHLRGGILWAIGENK